MRPIDYFLRAARLTPARPFLLDDHGSLTFAVAQARIDAIARGLQAAGCRADDSVAVYAPNHATAVLCLFGALRAGAAWVPVNVRNTAASNAEYMAYTRTRWLFFHADLARGRRDRGFVAGMKPP